MTVERGPYAVRQVPEVALLYWVLKRLALGPVLRLLFRPWVEGIENVPLEGGAIFASNHQSFSDSIFLPLIVERRVTFPAKAEYFSGRGLKGRLTAMFFRGVGQVPIDRSGGRASLAALEAGKKILDRGELFGIYPEGTRSPDGKLYRGKTGVARLALEAGVPVLPVAMVNTDHVQPIGQLVPRIGRVGIRIGAPLDFSRYEGMSRERFVLRSVTDEIMYAIMKLSEQEYVDMYADKRKLEIAEAKKAESAAKKSDGVKLETVGTDSATHADAPLLRGPMEAGLDADGEIEDVAEPPQSRAV